MLDHLPHADPPAEAAALKIYEDNLRELSQRPQIFVKGSEIVRRIDGRVSFDVASYKANLDRLWDLFGEDRIFFGSDWPNSDSLASLRRNIRRGAALHRHAQRNRATKVLLEEFDFGVQVAAAHNGSGETQERVDANRESGRRSHPGIQSGGARDQFIASL